MTIKKLVLGIMALGIVASILNGGEPPSAATTPAPAKTPAEKLESTKFGTAYQCVETIRANLHDPDKAELPHPINVPVDVKKNQFFVAHVSGRAENGFGGMRKLTWHCKVKSDGNSWLVVDITER